MLAVSWNNHQSRKRFRGLRLLKGPMSVPRSFAMMFHVLHPEEDGWIVAECPALPDREPGPDEK